VIDKDVISRCVEASQRQGFDAITLFERSIVRENSFVQRVLAYDKWIIHTNRDDDINFGAAIPRFFKAEVLKKAKCPPGLITFDHNLLYAAAFGSGGHVGFLEAYIYHHEPSSWSELARKFFRYGYYYIPAFRANGRLVAFHSLPRRAYFTKNVVKEPSMLGGLFILYLIKVLASAVGAATMCLETYLDKTPVRAVRSG
jgi:hypothetical protein